MDDGENPAKEKVVLSSDDDSDDDAIEELEKELREYECPSAKQFKADLAFERQRHRSLSVIPNDADNADDDSDDDAIEELEKELRGYECPSAKQFKADLAFERQRHQSLSVTPNDADNSDGDDNMGFSDPQSSNAASVREFVRRMRKKDHEFVIADLPPTIFQVKPISKDELLLKLYELVKKSQLELENEDPFEFEIPELSMDIRKLTNATFNETLGFFVCTEDGKLRKEENDFNSARMSTIYLSLLERIVNLLDQGTSITERAIWYSNEDLFWTYDTVAKAIDDLCVTFRCTRSSLNIFSPSKGFVYGNLVFEAGGKVYDCNNGFESIPDEKSIENMIIKSWRAVFILLVESYATFDIIRQSKIPSLFECLLVTGKGQPDISTRRFLRLLREKTRLPVLGLVDCNPDGFNIMSVYKHGTHTSKAFGNVSLVVPDIEWIGVHPKDMDTFGSIMNDLSQPLNERERNMCHNRLNEGRVQNVEGWEEQLKFMLHANKKIEIEALARCDHFLTEKYLPKKLLDYVSR